MSKNGDSDIFLGDLAYDVERAFDIEFGGKENLNTFCPWCEDEHTSRSPSCSVSSSGAFHCKSCKRRGTGIDFYAHKHQVAKPEAVRLLKYKPGESQAAEAKKKTKRRPTPKISDQLVDRLHDRLMRSSFHLSYLNKRGITNESIQSWEIGVDEQRITFPVRDEADNLIQLRRYMPSPPEGIPKFVCHLGGDGGPHWFPAINNDEAAQHPYLLLDEGELDTILARQEGFCAHTITSGVQTWGDEFTERLIEANRPVVIIYDVNDKDADLGQRIAKERANILVAAGLQVKVVRLPLPDAYVGGDLTDWWINEKRTSTELRQVIEDTPWWEWTPGIGADTAVQQDPDAPLVTLYDAANAKYFYKNIKLRCLVAGRGYSPYLLPSRIQVDLTMEDGATRTIERSFDPWDGLILNLIQCSMASQKRFIRAFLGIPQNVAMNITVLESLNVEELFLIPAVDTEHEQGPYVFRQCFYVGHGIETNRVYDFEGYTLPDPHSQAATHILTSAKPGETDLDQVELTEENYNALRTTFQTSDVLGKIEEIADQLAAHVTHIYGRSDLHTAIDLVFHSPLSFEFDGTRLRKGWLETLILGDTRTGKGFVTEGFVRHYGVGEVISGENLSIPGLIGGIQKAGDNLTLVWGKVPLADGRLIVLDEAGGLSTTEIGRLSRVRSEGIAEVTKIRSEKTKARTRLIWLANPRPSLEGKPKLLSSYNYGVEAVTELIGAAEDIARFDFILTVAQSEVPSKLINKHHKAKGQLLYTTDICRKLIVWIWSRRPEHIIFQQEAINHIYKAADSLGSYFSPSVPLVQPEDVRFKLARIACAAAARTFSTDDGIHLIIKQEHVEFAYNFLHHIYSKPSCGYSQMSVSEKERSTLRDPAGIKNLIMQLGAAAPDLVSGMLEHRQITARDLCDYASLDIIQARMIISELVRLRALTKDYNGYVKKPAFKAFLSNLHMRLVEDVHVTSHVDEGDSNE